MKKVVLLGGSFNPIHFGHLKMMRTAIKQVNASEGWFILANQAPLKKGYEVSFDDRKEMVLMMIKPYRHLKLCEIEKDLPNPNYTINTISALKKKYPDVQFYFLIGSDQAVNIDKWKSIDELFKLVKFIVYPRDDIKVNDDRFQILEPLEGKLDVSSTDIREMKSFQTHPAILRKIAQDGFYEDERLSRFLSTERYQHVMRVRNLAVMIAKKHKLNVKRIEALALLHDLFKELDNDSLKTFLNKEQAKDRPYFWHAYACASHLAKEHYVLDKRFLNSIYHHGDGNSQTLESKVIYIADKCEPNRNYDTSYYVSIALKDINLAYKLVKSNSNKYNINKEKL